MCDFNQNGFFCLVSVTAFKRSIPVTEKADRCLTQAAFTI